MSLAEIFHGHRLYISRSLLPLTCDLLIMGTMISVGAMLLQGHDSIAILNDVCLI
jgi:hypothetical protein